MKLLLAFSVLSTVLLASPLKKFPHIQVGWAWEKSALETGKENVVAFRLKPDAGWHVYWRNPGDSGQAPKVNWKLPAGFSASELDFPVPERIPLKIIANYGYSTETFLFSKINVPANLTTKKVTASAELKWLVCQEECVPGKTVLTQEFPVSSAAVPVSADWTSAISSTKAHIPKKMGSSGAPQFQVKASENPAGILRIDVTGVEAREPIDFFPSKKTLVEAIAPRTVKATAQGFSLTIPKREGASATEVQGLLVVGQDAVEIDFPLAGAVSGQADTSLLLMLLFAFIGGLILNLMPCVLPVLSIKVFSIVEQSGQKPKQIRRHGIAFALGVLTSFWILAAVLFGLRSGSAQLGWGFQLQSPYFIAFLIFLFFFMALNLLGVFEWSGKYIGLGGNLTSREGYSGSFFTGVLSTIAATPCSAPFMGTALGFALSQPSWVGWLILTCLGLGLSFPYLAFSFFPGSGKILPRPGKWMETLRQALAFPLFGTVLWLLLVLSKQVGSEGVVRILTGLSIGYFILWFFQRFNKTAIWAKAVVVVLSLVTVAQISLLPLQLLTGGPVASRNDGWTPYNEAALEAAIASGKPVFIDFTAEWCVQCKVNEGVALNKEKVQNRFRELGVVLIKADWTNGDPAITRTLASHQRNSVPLYLYYAPGQKIPAVLPQVLTPDLVLSYLK